MRLPPPYMLLLMIFYSTNPILGQEVATATTTEPSSEVSDVPSDHTSPESGHHVNATVIEEDLTKPRPPVPPTPEEIARRKHKMEILQRVHRLQHLMKRLKQQKMLQEQKRKKQLSSASASAAAGTVHHIDSDPDKPVVPASGAKGALVGRKRLRTKKNPHWILKKAPWRRMFRSFWTWLKRSKRFKALLKRGAKNTMPSRRRRRYRNRRRNRRRRIRPKRRRASSKRRIGSRKFMLETMRRLKDHHGTSATL